MATATSQGSTPSSTVSINLPSLHQGQITVLREAERFNWLFAGRRWRKTSLVLGIAFEGNPFKPDQVGALHGAHIVWGAPTAAQSDVGWAAAKRACQSVPQIVFHETRKTVFFPNGGRIFFRSLDNPDSPRGLTAHGVVVDEMQDCDPRAWHEVLRPMLIDTRGWFWGIGTPKGRNWVFKQYQSAQVGADNVKAWRAPLLGAEIRPGRPRSKIVRVPHPLENPYISFEELEDMYNDPDTPERSFRQEVLAEFLSSGGGVFNNVEECASEAPQEGPVAGRDYVMGVDLGKVEDFTWLTVMDAEDGREVASERFNLIEYALQKDRIIDLARIWKPINIVIERNGQESFVEDLINDDLPITPFKTDNLSKGRLINDLALAFEKMTIRIINDPVRKTELISYEMKPLEGSNMIRYSAPKGMHDDGVISLALAWFGVIRGRVYSAPGLY